MSTKVFMIRPTTNIQNDTKDDEPYDSDDLDDGEAELSFTVAFDTKEVNGDNCDQENSDPDGGVDFSGVWPEGEGYGGGDDFKGEGDEPLESIAISLDISSLTSSINMPIKGYCLGFPVV